MKILRTVSDVRAALAGPRARGRVGLVPTMGALHDGHTSLIRAARGECDTVVVTLFVNPAQFGDPADLSAYPRDEANDARIAAEAGADFVFAPAAEEIYRSGHATWVDVEGAAEGLEGECRPGHFRGVATVCLKLFLITAPHRAYFGQKDAQQLAVIRQMVRDLNLPVEIVAMPIVRESDGLAMSSRNAYLTPEQRTAASVLALSLSLAERMYDDAERDASQIRDAVREFIGREPLAEIDYVSIADAETLDEIDVIERESLVSVAVRLGTTRLIDNTVLRVR